MVKKGKVLMNAVGFIGMYKYISLLGCMGVYKYLRKHK